jgi:hypothetical protein
MKAWIVACRSANEAERHFDFLPSRPCIFRSVTRSRSLVTHSQRHSATRDLVVCGLDDLGCFLDGALTDAGVWVG